LGLGNYCCSDTAYCWFDIKADRQQKNENWTNGLKISRMCSPGN
jgi:hypothetical protein